MPMLIFRCGFINPWSKCTAVPVLFLKVPYFWLRNKLEPKLIQFTQLHRTTLWSHKFIVLLQEPGNSRCQFLRSVQTVLWDTKILVISSPIYWLTGLRLWLVLSIHLCQEMHKIDQFWFDHLLFSVLQLKKWFLSTFFQCFFIPCLTYYCIYLN